MQNLGIILPHLGSSQAAYEAIKLANKVENAVIFFEQLMSPCLPINCATMCVNELMSFKGLLITTSISNTMLAHNLTNRNQVQLLFYVWDLEWLRPNKQNYLYNIQAYSVPDFLVARSEEHIGPITNYCNRKPVFKEFEQVIKC